MANETQGQQVREAVGVFVEAEQLKRAASALLEAGFDRGALGLLAGQEAVQRSLGDLYNERQVPSDDSQGPATGFVEHESIGDTAHAWVGGVSLAGTTALGAAVVASAAVLGGALVAATAGAAAVGAVGAAMGAIIHKSDAEYLEEQIDDGRLLLFARTRDADEEGRAARTLSEHGALDTKVITVERPES